MSVFNYEAKTAHVLAGNIGTPQFWIVDTLCEPSGPIHDVATSRSISGQVNIKTLWKTTEELSIIIPCIIPSEYARAKEFLFSIGSQPFEYDATDIPFIGGPVQVKLKTTAIKIPPVSPRSLFRTARFIVQPVI